MYGALALDPIGLRPWDLARLTDFQVERLYRRPAERRAAERAGGPGAAPAAGREAPGRVDAGDAVRAAVERGQPPPKAVMMSLLMGLGGMSAKDASDEYDRQLAEWQQQKGGAT